ncbi:MAG: SAM-dependent chlorinase/fluorinase [Cruoricaptor ignavus]|nr:SAM-dependent chlorinase/fluorinase [Cruoricaptor ignavus]
MSVITLTSDFGLVDYRVAATKGNILSLKQDATIVDISHEIEAYNLMQTAYIVRNAYKHFPEGSVHIISVDSFHRKEVKSVLYKADGHYFIAADNGVLSLIFYDINPEYVYEITLNNRFDDEVISTTNDIFVPSAVHLINGGLPEIIGRPYHEAKEISFPRAVYAENESHPMIVGQVMYIDNYGNLVSNIHKNLFYKSKVAYEKFRIKFRNLALSNVYNKHTDFVNDWDKEREYHGKAVAVFNEADLLELCIYKGQKNNGAKTLFGLNVGESIYIEFSKE